MSSFEALLADYRSCLHLGRESKIVNRLATCDQNRDDALATLFTLHRGYRLVKQEATKSAYQLLASLFKFYQNLERMTYEKETEGINYLLKQLEAENYQQALTQLNLLIYVEELKTAQQAFEKAYKERLAESKGKKIGKAKQLRENLDDLYDFFIIYTASSAYGSPDKPTYADLRDQLNVIRKRFGKTKSSKASKDEDATQNESTPASVN